MRAPIQIAAASVVGALLVFGCGTSDSDMANVAGGAGTAPEVEAGSGGGNDQAGGAAGAGGAGGHTLVHVDDVAGAGAGGACAGEYECPSIGYPTWATIRFDLPISVAVAANAVFTACRNDECHTDNGNAKAGPNATWAEEAAGSGSIYLTFDDSGAAPFGQLLWYFSDFNGTDHYSLTVQPVGAPSPVTLFDTQVSYTTVELPDPTLVEEGFCHRCSETSAADVDLRTAQ